MLVAGSRARRGSGGGTGLTKRAFRKISSLAAVVPIAGMWAYSALRFYANYGGTCGLLGAGWPCTRAPYVEYLLTSVFVLPILALWSSAALKEENRSAGSIRRAHHRCTGRDSACGLPQ
jgi:hypothetical protein